jgi:hypothetical protein
MYDVYRRKLIIEIVFRHLWVVFWRDLGILELTYSMLTLPPRI